MDLASELVQMLIALDGYTPGRIELVENVPISDRLETKKIPKDKE